MNRRSRPLEVAVLLTYLAAWFLGPFVVLCVENDGRVHFELALGACCDDGLSSGDHNSGQVRPLAMLSEDPTGDDCEDCTDFSVATPAVLAAKNGRIETALAALVASSFHPKFLSVRNEFPDLMGHAAAKTHFSERIVPPRSAHCVFQI